MYQCGSLTIPLKKQGDLGKQLGHDNPFNAKSDNFLGLSKINNLVICSLQDEENVGVVESVGTL